MYPDYFVPAFDLTIRSQANGEVRDYARPVDFQTGEATVHWADNRGVFEHRMQAVQQAERVKQLLGILDEVAAGDRDAVAEP